MRPVELRADLRDLPPYTAPQFDGVVRLNTNESPLSPPQAFFASLQHRIETIAFNRYPDREVRELRDGLGARFGRSGDGVWVANGSNEILQTILLAFGGPQRRLLTFEPTYAMYRQLARVSMTEFDAVPVADPFTLDVATVTDAITQHTPHLVFLCSPNNPTGAAISLDVIKAALAASDGLVVVDQAYGEFGGTAAESLLDEHERLVCVRSFSKSWRMAGARLGYAVAHPWFVEALQVARLPYHLSAVSQAVGAAALDHADALLEGCAQIATERDRVAESLRALGADVFPSDANFLLFRTSQHGSTLWRRLVDEGVLVRDMTSQVPDALRVTISTPDEDDRFLEAMRSVT